MNPRLTKKDLGLIKSALRKAFSRSQLHAEVIKEAIVEHSDPKRPKVKTWVRCTICKKPEAKSYIVVDHVSPVIPIGSSFEELGVDETVNRLWCEKNNLQCCDKACHDEKSARERKQRKEVKNGKSS